MKKIILLSAMASSMLLATNGDNLISLGAESRAMGGTGIAMAMGTDSVFKNPAWLADVEGAEAMFGATLFMPDVKAKNSSFLPDGSGNASNGVEATSKADMSMIPAVSHADRINENWAYGVGMFGVSGMGTDYRNEDGNKGLGNMRTNFQYMRFVPSIAYKQDNLRLGAGLTLAYGALDMSAVMPDGALPGQAILSTSKQRGGGMSDDFGFGAQFGVAYTPTSNINLGAYYQTEVATEYKDVFDFNTNGTYDDLKLSQPAEYGVGIGYHQDGLRVSADVKQISWSSADGYKQFGWDDQMVYSLGLGYKVSSAMELRGGYSYAKSPLDDQFEAANISSANAPFAAGNIAFFNMMGFPAISETHITAGLGYQFTDKVGIDLAYVYSPKETLAVNSPATLGTMQVTNEQNSISGALKYKFD
ncbi:outer membrane protein transport protein [bacterium]|nr:outer membrane protein transport protein [bacterium]MBU1958516.1 outer membrane protein transport protein [bacterium]